MATDRNTGPITVQGSPFPLERPNYVFMGSVFAHHNALQEVLPPSAMAHASTLSRNELVGAMAGEDIAAMVKAAFHAGMMEMDPVRIGQLVDEAFLGIRYDRGLDSAFVRVEPVHTTLYL